MEANKIFPPIVLTSPEMLEARLKDLLGDLKLVTVEANRSGVYKLLGLPKEIDEKQISSAQNFRVLLSEKLNALLVNIELPEYEDKSDDAEKLRDTEFAIVQLLASIKVYDELEAEAKEVMSATEEAA